MKYVELIDARVEQCALLTTSTVLNHVTERMEPSQTATSYSKIRVAAELATS